MPYKYLKIHSVCLTNQIILGEYRSRSATMVTDRSDFSQNQPAETRTAQEMSEITTEIIGPPKPTLATIGKRASRGTRMHKCTR